MRLTALTFDPLPTCGYIERGSMRVPLVHPDHRYRQLGRWLIRDCFQDLPEDFQEGPCPSAAPQG